jgi:hypothetical protein
MHAADRYVEAISAADARHKAMIQCARYAFGFAGIVDPDEAERIGVSPMKTVGPRDSGPPMPPKIEHKDVELVTSGLDEGKEVVWDDETTTEDAAT